MTVASQLSDYAVFGLHVRSAVELPELFAAASDEAADVVIRRGTVPAVESDSEGMAVTDHGVVLDVPNIARFLISDGRTIIVDAIPGVPERNVRLFLLGSAFGALLHQRRLLPLHANAVEINGRACAFMGHSGAGKSTLAAWMVQRGYRLIADDVCVVGYDPDGVPQAAPGLPRLRLWAEALELMGKARNGLARSYASDEDEKYDLPVGRDSTALLKRPLRAIYLLDQADAFAVTQIQGIEAAEAIFANTYRGSFLAMTGGQKQHWESVIRLVRGTPVFRACREWGLGNLDSQCRRLLAHAESMAADVVSQS